LSKVPLLNDFQLVSQCLNRIRLKEKTRDYLPALTSTHVTDAYEDAQAPQDASYHPVPNAELEAELWPWSFSLRCIWVQERHRHHRSLQQYDVREI